jgi:hypothetical protein
MVIVGSVSHVAFGSVLIGKKPIEIEDIAFASGIRYYIALEEIHPYDGSQTDTRRREEDRRLSRLPETLNRMREIDIRMSESPEAPEIENQFIHRDCCGIKTENPFHTGQMTPKRRAPKQ